MAIRYRLAKKQKEIGEWRQYLHRHPELGFDTFKTAEFVQQKLQQFGCDEVTGGIGRTGIVGLIHGRDRTSGKVVGLRADMDALPIIEATGAKYASQNDGKMHACGHDGHTAMLLGAASYLAETRNFNGTVAVIFQPAEEKGGGGKVMVDEGLMERFSIDEVYGMHNMPGLNVGEFAIRSGIFFAAADTVSIILKGKGGHGAFPHMAADTTLAACHLVTSLQSIVSRNVDPVQPAVLSICSFQTKTRAHNVIPQNVELLGTIRSVDLEVRDGLIERIQRISQSIGTAFGVQAEVKIETGYPAMVNSIEHTLHAIEAAQRVSEAVNDDMDIVMGAEDFAFMLNARPGAYILTGNGDSAPLHHPEYDFNDDAISSGSSWWVEIAESRLSVTEEN